MPITHDRLLAEACDAASAQGKEDGTSRASWFFDGNTTDRTYRAALRGIDDGDPEILDCFPFLDLSGQWADGLTTHEILSWFLEDPGAWESEEQTEVLDAYQMAYDDAVVDEIARAARVHLAQEGGPR